MCSRIGGSGSCLPATARVPGVEFLPSVHPVFFSVFLSLLARGVPELRLQVRIDKLKKRWPDIAKHFGGSTPPRPLQNKTRTFQSATATGVEQDQAHAGLQVNVEPIASHQQSTIAYVRRLLDNRRPAGLQAIREMLAGSVDPVTPLQVHTCIDGLLPGLVDDRRSFDVAEEADVGGLVVSD